MRKSLFLIFLFLPVAMAAPRQPAEDAEVLERLPGGRDAPAMAEIRVLRAALARDPRNAEAAARLARRYFSLANAQGDPRYVGYAEAALKPWAHEAPTPIRYARALLRQYRHDFSGALDELAAALAAEPQHYGARAWRAAIFMVRADYAAALRECEALPEDLYGIGCRAYVDATTGNARAAQERLGAALARHGDEDADTKLWVLTRLAEMAWRLGDAAAAERRFREALALGLEDNFLLAAYADFLLESGRAPEVVALLKERSRSDTLLLRLALAGKTLGAPQAGAHVQTLGERFAAAALRGERLHLAEEARYLLDLRGDAKAALAAALENWKDQREPRDALIVLEAALAAREPAAAAPVLGWLEESRFEGVRLRQIAARLR